MQDELNNLFVFGHVSVHSCSQGMWLSNGYFSNIVSVGVKLNPVRVNFNMSKTFREKISDADLHVYLTLVLGFSVPSFWFPFSKFFSSVD